jgi:tetratricopeptide (TPR) repeat protein
VPSSSQADDLRDWFDAFAQIQNGEQMLDFYRRIPSEIEDNFISLVEKVIADVEATGNADTASHLQTRLEAFKQICEAAKQATTSNADNPLQSALQEYLSQREAAEKTEQDREAWQRAADAGEGLLSMLGTVAIDAEQLSAIKADIASTYNMLGNTFDDVDKQQALAAFDRAIALQPDFAMWHRNRAGTLIELGRLDDAEAAIARARELEPDAKRLPELDAELAAARSKAAQPQND